MFHFEAQAQDKVSLIKRQFVVTHTIRQTKIPAQADSWVTNTPSVKILCPQKSASPSFFAKHGTLMFWSINDSSSIFHLLQDVDYEKLLFRGQYNGH